jgi:type VI secretion system protein VasD
LLPGEEDMKNANRLLYWVVIGTGLLMLTACPKEVRLNMVLSAASNVNPDPSGNALSVVVRVYQLKDKGRLETADYNAILKSDKETLSDDFLDRQERVVQPGTMEMLDIKPNPSATYVGVVALFRNPTGDTWRKIIPIKGSNVTIRLNLREQSIELGSVGK